MDENSTRILRLPQVRAMVGLGHDRIYAMARNRTFPRPIKLTARASGWLESEIQAWIAARIAERDSAAERSQAAADV
jgi:prophage regulatory protein